MELLRYVYRIRQYFLDYLADFTILEPFVSHKYHKYVCKVKIKRHFIDSVLPNCL